MNNTERLKLLGITGRGTKAAPVTQESREEWQLLYDEAGSASALARRLHKPVATVIHHLRRQGINLRSGFRSPKTVVHRGPSHHNWRGGTYLHSDGYVYEYAPEHPDAPKSKGYVLQHRLVIERSLGRYLTPDECVHHRNEKKDDNRLENLEVTARSPHMRHHKKGALRDSRGRFLA